MFQTNVVDKIKSTYFMFSNIFRNSYGLCGNVENMAEPDRTQMTIWRMRSTCWIPKGTHTQNTKYIAFPQQHWLLERATILRYTHIGCLLVS
jgi:hypothetical protein